MNIIGKWKLKGIYVPSEVGLILYTGNDIPESHAEIFEENRDMILEFTEDGALNTVVEAIGPYLEMAAADGIDVRKDGYIVAFSTQWENRNGRIYYNSEFEGEILEEAADPFVEIGVTEDGCILYNFGMFLYERI